MSEAGGKIRVWSAERGEPVEIDMPLSPEAKLSKALEDIQAPLHDILGIVQTKVDEAYFLGLACGALMGAAGVCLVLGFLRIGGLI